MQWNLNELLDCLDMHINNTSYYIFVEWNFEKQWIDIISCCIFLFLKQNSDSIVLLAAPLLSTIAFKSSD
jgi:hypothetical protein